MVLFGFFTSPPEITIKLDGDRGVHKRILCNSYVNVGKEIQSSELCPLVQDNEQITGRVIIRQKIGQTLEHIGIYIELIGSVERHGEISRKDDFSSSRIQLLAPMADNFIAKETIILDFDFGNTRFPYESYDGNGISLRYFLRAVISRKMTDITKEATLWCLESNNIKDINEVQRGDAPIEIDVGLEDFLHIKLRLEKCRFTFNDEIVGILRFLLVRVRVVDVEINLVRKEFGADDVLIDQAIITSKQILDGSAYKGDTVPVQLDLASIADRLSPTMEMVNKMFSVKYFVGVVLRDAECRKYYKQVEVELVKDNSNNVLVNYKFGLVADQ